MSRPAIAEVNLSAILANYRLACELAPQSQSLAVVKANAYGHGAIAVSRYLEPHVPAFAVAAIEEALRLREAGISKPILLLEGTFTPDEVSIAANNNFWLMIDNLLQVDAIVAQPQQTPLQVWLKVDSGMHRLGLNEAQFLQALKQLEKCDWVATEKVIASHFACADELQNPFTDQQIAYFGELSKHAKSAKQSLANSAAVLAHKKARLDWNRPGYMLYGGKSVFNENSAKIRPTMTLKSAVIGIREVAAGDIVGYGASWTAERDAVIATVAVGYGDGYPRQFGNGTPVIVNGQRAKLAGRVSMDMITVDVTDLGEINIGDEVTLWGEDLPIDELAPYANTIGYELITGMTGRVPITYIED